MSTDEPGSTTETNVGRDYSLLLAIALGMLTIVGAFALLPSTEEKASAMLAEGRPAEARALLESREAGDGLTSYERLMLADLYAGAGELSPAGDLLETLATEPAHTALALSRLVTVYGKAGDYSQQLGAALRLYEQQPSQELYARQRSFSRLLGDWHQEALFLDAAIRAGHATPADFQRRQHLRTVSADVMAATAVWRAPEFALPILTHS